MSSYINIEGKDYYSPCAKCTDSYCSSCILQKYRNDFNAEREKRESAEFRIENELTPRIEAERRSYDFYVTTDRSAEWCDCFDFRVNELVEMFDEDFDFASFDFDGEDVVSKIGKTIYEHLKKEGKVK